MATRQHLIDTVVKKCEASNRVQETKNAMLAAYREFQKARAAHMAAVSEHAGLEREQGKIESELANTGESEHGEG